MKGLDGRSLNRADTDDKISLMGQLRRFDRLPDTSGPSRTTDISGPPGWCEQAMHALQQEVGPFDQLIRTVWQRRWNAVLSSRGKCF
jgi:hypothetical protein